MRTFIAIELPQEIRNILSNAQDELRQARADVKWVKPENIHLTLKFLGEINQDLSKQICLVLNEIARRNSCFTVYLSGFGAFPKLQYPRVIWAGLSNDQPVIEIAKDLEKELLELGLPAESRAFNSHITLGRVRSGKNRGVLIERLERLNKELCSTTPPEFKVTAFTLFKSTLTPTGPIYEALLNCPLK